MTVLLVVINNCVTLMLGIGIGLALAPWLADAMVKEGIIHLADEDTMPPPKSRKLKGNDILLLVLIFVLVAGFTVTGVTSYTAGQDAKTANAGVVAQVGCNRQFANRLADALEPRSKANDAYQAADVAVNLALIAVLTPGNDDADLDALRKATLAKDKTRTELEKQKKANPYPDPPREVCPK